MKTVLTGIRPTGNLHLGHYFGAVKNWLKLQDEYETFIEIADVQALTDNFDNPKKVEENILELTIDLLSCGIDPKKTHIFLQSAISEIAELTVFYSNLVTISRLYRNPTVKSEIMSKKNLFGENGEGVTFGFVGYPISQAADITALDGDLIPAGEDQEPLVEQCREIVRKFNRIYGDTLKEPTIYLSKTPRIKGLDGNYKMGKSLNNAIYLKDQEEILEKKIMSAITDTNKLKKDDPANPDVCMVYYYHKITNNKNLDAICKECKNGKRGCVFCKKELISHMMEFLKEYQEKRLFYETHPEEVKKILKEGTEAAKKRAEETIKKVKEKMRLNYLDN